MRVWPGNQFRIYTPRSRFDLAFRGGLPPAGPSAAQVFAGPGEDPGEIFISIFGPPSQLGDGPTPGDGLGEITGYQLQIAGGAWITYGTALPIEQTFTGFGPGAPVSWAARALGHGGRLGQMIVGSALAKDVTPDPEIETIFLTNEITGDYLTNKLTGAYLVSVSGDQLAPAP